MLSFAWARSTPLLGLVVHSMKPAVEVMRPGRLGTGNTDHVVVWMEAFGLATSAKIKVGTHHTFVSEADDRSLAAIAQDTGVLFAVAITRGLAVVSGVVGLVGGQDFNCQLVDGTLHLGQGNDQFVVRTDGDLVSVLILPGQLEVLSTERRIDGGQLLTEVSEGSAYIAIDDETTDLGVDGVGLVEGDFVGDGVIFHLELRKLDLCWILVKLKCDTHDC